MRVTHALFLQVALKGDVRVTHALTETALLHEDVLTRKVAIEALEVLAVLGYAVHE